VKVKAQSIDSLKACNKLLTFCFISTATHMIVSDWWGATDTLHSKSDQAFFNAWPWWPSRHFERQQLFYLNTEMVIRQGCGECW